MYHDCGLLLPPLLPWLVPADVVVVVVPATVVVGGAAPLFTGVTTAPLLHKPVNQVAICCLSVAEVHSLSHIGLIAPALYWTRKFELQKHDW